MKNFFKNKINILLIVLLVVFLGALGFLAYKILNKQETVIVPNFENKQVVDVNSWCSDNNLADACIISYEFSDDVKENFVIYQSVKEDVLVDNVSFIISKGKENKNVVNIDIPVIDDETTKEDIALWVTENKLVNVTYVYEKSDEIVKDNIIKIIPNKITSLDTKVTVYISLGSEGEYEDEDYIIVEEGAYIGLTKEEFKKKVEAKDLTVGDYVEEYNEFSDDIEKGLIVWHGSGEHYVVGEGVRYALSLGKGITLDPEKYLGLSVEEFEAAMEKLGLKAETDGDNDKYSDYDADKIRWYKSDKTYGEGDIVYYSISKGKKIVVDSKKYLGLKEEDFIKAITELGLIPYNDGDNDKLSEYDSGCVRWYKTDIDYAAGDQLNYSVSAGKYEHHIINSSDYTNKTVDEFKADMNKKGLKAGNSSKEYSDTVSEGKIIRVSGGDYKTGDLVDYVISKGKEPEPVEIVYIMRPNMYDPQIKDSFENTKSAFLALDTFSKLGSAVTFQSVDGYSLGDLVSISVNGNESYEAGNYVVGQTTVVIKICGAVIN